MSVSPLTGNLSLNPFTFAPLALGSIKPLGWLHDQMQLMSDGLAGHEHDFYPIVSDSRWLGGQSEYSGLNEGIPYWLNGLVPLAYGLNNDRLKSQTGQVVDYILDHQQSDGWLGPEVPANRDIWGRFPLCLGLMQLVEAEPSTASRVLPALYEFVSLMHKMLAKNAGYEQFWGRVRYPDMIITLQWLYEKHPGNSSYRLLETMSLLNQKGLRWADYYTQGEFIFKDLDTVRPPITDRSPLFPYVHAVNAAQGMKAGAAIYRFNDDASLLQSTRKGVSWTLGYHGDPAGSITGDERESGQAPNRGSELCTAVETMYSLSYLYQTMGDGQFADGSPNYPCCTVNMPQGLPKFLSNSFVQVDNNGLGHALLSPARVETTLPSGNHVSLSCNTTYPFGDTLYYTFNASAPFILNLRVPAWAMSYEIIASSNDGSSPKTYDSSWFIPDPHTGMLSLDLLRTGTVEYKFHNSIRTEDRGNSTISVYRGALLYALDVGYSDTTISDTTSDAEQYPLQQGRIPPQAHDHIIINTKPWNFAIDPSTLAYHFNHTSSSTDGSIGATLPNPIWAYEAPPPYITAQGCQIEWGIENGLPARPPLEGERKCIGIVTEVVLRPYGSLKVHMAVLPTMDLEKVKE
ncbi:MAG: hypothetical protein Q9204_000337 [Flavoplaca sp. TL-2023a]